MPNRKRTFPLVPDDEPVIGQSTAMHLYDNEDLITNIQGNYYEKDYTPVTPALSFSKQNPVVEKDMTDWTDLDITYAQEARLQAKEDLRQKRQRYVKQELERSQKPSAFVRKSHKLSEKREALVLDNNEKQLAQPFSRRVTDSKTTKKPVSTLAKHAQKLHQESYILVDLPKVYHQPDNSKDRKQTKNNYDFLKRSQIYNQQERQENRERQMAQELNLTRFKE